MVADAAIRDRVRFGRAGRYPLGQGFRAARWVTLLLPAVLLAGAWTGQLWGGLVPCEMCHWQRWPHYGAIVIAFLSFVPPFRRELVALAAVAIAASGAIGAYHAGIEWHWWGGLTACSSTLGAGHLTIDDVLRAPLVRCDEAQWRLLGISLAGWNALFSLCGAGAIGWLLRSDAR